MLCWKIPEGKTLPRPLNWAVCPGPWGAAAPVRRDAARDAVGARGHGTPVGPGPAARAGIGSVPPRAGGSSRGRRCPGSGEGAAPAGSGSAAAPAAVPGGSGAVLGAALPDGTRQVGRGAGRGAGSDGSAGAAVGAHLHPALRVSSFVSV